MPIYEYACGSCEHRFETIQKASEGRLRDCPECGAEDLKKLLSAPVFRLKGTGWYETDFKSKDRKNVAGDGGDKAAETGNGDKSESSENGKAEAAKTGEAKAKDSGAKSTSGGDGGSKTAASKSGD